MKYSTHVDKTQTDSEIRGQKVYGVGGSALAEPFAKLAVGQMTDMSIVKGGGIIRH